MATEEISEVGSAGRIGQLGALLLKMKSVNRNSTMAKSESILKNEMHGARKGVPNVGTYNKYGRATRKVGIGSIRKRGAFKRAPFSGIPDGGR